MEKSNVSEAAPSFPCPKEGCGGDVTATACDGRFFFHRQILINFPAHIALPKCDRCMKDYVDETLRTAVDEILEAQYLFHKDMIVQAFDRLKKTPGDN